eukprot:c45850_g1_i1.p1 GENE.c45850_g1_i1~~c45850_g1_i1.p1  ORF type:complete len:1654 (+),score=437.19 c45850_g1_i1:151-5112(+)
MGPRSGLCGAAIFLMCANMSAGIGDGATRDLCYKVNYRMQNSKYTLSQLVKPVTGFPSQHAKVVNGVCGGATAGSPIPEGINGCSNCRWSVSGIQQFEQCSSSNACITPPYTQCSGDGQVNAGSLFYAYNSPIDHSSNTGYNEFETSLSYFVTDTGGNTWFVLTHDKPNNLDGGSIRLKINSSNIPNAFVAQMDDPSTLSTTDSSACDLATNDCYAWDQSTQTGGFYWRWGPCCTDGMVFGPLPSSDFQLSLQFTEVQGISAYKFGSFLSENFNLTKQEMTLDDMMSGVMVEGFTCDEFCASLSNCGECSSNPDCSWCTDSNGAESCVSAKSTQTCSTQIHDACCPSCDAFSSCDSCSQHAIDLGCGWCASSQKCLSGNDKQPCESCSEFLFAQPLECPVEISPKIEVSKDSDGRPGHVSLQLTCFRAQFESDHSRFVSKYVLVELESGDVFEQRSIDDLGEEDFFTFLFSTSLNFTNATSNISIQIEARDSNDQILGFDVVTAEDLIRPEGSVLNAKASQDVATSPGIVTLSVSFQISSQGNFLSSAAGETSGSVFGYRLYVLSDFDESADLISTILESSDGSQSATTSFDRKFDLIGVDVSGYDEFVIVPFDENFEADLSECSKVSIDDVEGLTPESQAAITSVAVVAGAFAVASSVVAGGSVGSTASSMVSSVSGTDPVILAANFQNIGAMSQLQIDTLSAKTRDFCSSLAWSNGDFRLFKGHETVYSSSPDASSIQSKSFSNTTTTTPNANEHSQAVFLITRGRTSSFYFREIATGFILAMAIGVVVAVSVALYREHSKARKLRKDSKNQTGKNSRELAEACQAIVVAITAVFYFGIANATLFVLWRGNEVGASDKIVAYLALVFILVGLPAFIAFDIWRVSRPTCPLAKKISIQNRYRFLTVSLNPEHSMYAVLNLVRRLGMAFSIVFLVSSPVTQCLVFASLNFCMLAVVLWVNPFKGGRRSITFWVEVLFQIIHTVTVLVPVVQYYRRDYSNKSSTAILSLQMAVICLSMAYVVATVIAMIRNSRKQKRANLTEPSSSPNTQPTRPRINPYPVNTTPPKTRFQNKNMESSKNLEDDVHAEVLSICREFDDSGKIPGLVRNLVREGESGSYSICSGTIQFRVERETDGVLYVVHSGSKRQPLRTWLNSRAAMINGVIERDGQTLPESKPEQLPKATLIERAAEIARGLESEIPGIFHEMQAHVSKEGVFRIGSMTLQVTVKDGQLMQRVGGGYEELQSWLSRRKALVARALSEIDAKAMKSPDWVPVSFAVAPQGNDPSKQNNNSNKAEGQQTKHANKSETAEQTKPKQKPKPQSEQELREHEEQRVRENEMWEQQLRDQELRVQQIQQERREKQLREQQLREQQKLDQDRIREQQRIQEQERIREQERIQEQQRIQEQERIREQERIQEQQRIREQELREQQMREQQLRENQLREQQQRIREQELREQQEQQLREQVSTPQQVRANPSSTPPDDRKTNLAKRITDAKLNKQGSDLSEKMKPRQGNSRRNVLERKPSALASQQAMPRAAGTESQDTESTTVAEDEEQSDGASFEKIKRRCVEIAQILEAEIPGISAAFQRNTKSQGMYRIGSLTLILTVKDGAVVVRAGRGYEDVQGFLERRKATVKRGVASAGSQKEQRGWVNIAE